MNLLVTNTQAPQAYAIIRAMRSHADRIVATVEGNNPFSARLSHAANSRLVDKRVRVPPADADWSAGNIGPENTEAESAFVQAVARICEDEKIDVIFPSWDPHVYVLSKNKRLFANMGIVIPVPDFETLLTALDKYRSVLAAHDVGFPCPRTYLYDRDDLKCFAEHAGFPLVIKPRFTSGGRGMAVVHSYRELTETLLLVTRLHGRPVIQEYIPGGEENRFSLSSTETAN